MILADTFVWIDFFRSGDALMAERLNNVEILMHPFVLGELALGNLAGRDGVLAALSLLPRIETADDGEVMGFIGRQRLFGIGIGYVDAHLLAAVRLSPGASLWTRDKRLAAAASGLGVLNG